MVTPTGFQMLESDVRTPWIVSFIRIRVSLAHHINQKVDEVEQYRKELIRDLMDSCVSQRSF